MDLTARVKEYICFNDISRDYNINTAVLGSSLYNEMLTYTRAAGRALFDSSSLWTIAYLAQGHNKEAGLAALASAAFFLIDMGLKHSSRWIIDSKKIQE